MPLFWPQLKFDIGNIKLTREWILRCTPISSGTAQCPLLAVSGHSVCTAECLLLLVYPLLVAGDNVVAHHHARRSCGRASGADHYGGSSSLTGPSAALNGRVLISRISDAEATIAGEHRTAAGFLRSKTAILFDATSAGIHLGAPSAGVRRFQARVNGGDDQSTNQKGNAHATACLSSATVPS